MKIIYRPLLFLFFVFSLSCSSPSGSSNVAEEKPDSAQWIVDRAIEAQGFDQIANKQIAFDFRDKHYTAIYAEDGSYVFTRSFQKGDSLILDSLTNLEFKRYINENEQEISDEWRARYAASVNSVLYFALLPYRLNDEAVIKTYAGKQKLEEKTYDLVRLSFKQEGGGEDFDDEYLYWFNDKTGKIDYLAYNYAEEDGRGVRFRKAFEAHEVDDFIFNQYLNYGTDNGDVELSSLGDSLEMGRLELLSQIVNENIVVQ